CRCRPIAPPSSARAGAAAPRTGRSSCGSTVWAFPSARQDDLEAQRSGRFRLRVVVGQQAAQVKQLHCSQVQPVERRAVDGPRQTLPFGFRDQRRRAWLQLEGPESKQSCEPPSSLCRLGAGQYPDRLPPLDLDQGFELGQRRYRDIRFLADDFTRPDGLGLGEEQLEQCAGIDVQAHEEGYRSRSSWSSSSEEGWVGSPFEILRSQRM